MKFNTAYEKCSVLQRQGCRLLAGKTTCCIREKPVFESKGRYDCRRDRQRCFTCQLGRGVMPGHPCVPCHNPFPAAGWGILCLDRLWLLRWHSATLNPPWTFRGEATCWRERAKCKRKKQTICFPLLPAAEVFTVRVRFAAPVHSAP